MSLRPPPRGRSGKRSAEGEALVDADPDETAVAGFDATASDGRAAVTVAIPERIENPTPADYLSVMSRAVFQAGLSWKLIESKWDGYLRLFDDFDPAQVARYGEADIERILADGAVVRTRKKILATIENAKTLLALEREHGSLRAYLRSFGGYAALVADLRTRFKFLGELSAYYFLFRTGEPVPRFEDWEKTIPGDHPRMRDMVAHARQRGWQG
ncbi:MAG: DNA-3-methyladenine glycosylase I [Vulcanimicrobiaceae bacterium]